MQRPPLQAKSAGSWGGGAGWGRPVRRPRLYEQRIGDGEIACLRADTHRQIEDGLVGPLARLLSGQGIGRAGWRPELG